VFHGKTARQTGEAVFQQPPSIPFTKFDQFPVESSAVLVDQLRRELGGPQGLRSPKGRPKAAGPPGRVRAGGKRSELCDRDTSRKTLEAELLKDALCIAEIIFWVASSTWTAVISVT